MASVFDLEAILRLNSNDYDKGLANAGSNAKSFGQKLSTGLGTAAKVGAAAITAITTASVALTGALIKGTGETAKYGDNVDKMSQKLGLSAEAYQKWDYVLGQAGTSIDSMAMGIKTLTNKLDDAKNGSANAQEMFAKLGMSLEDIQSMSREEVFEAAIKGFQGMADSTERAALANDLFGRSGQELTPLFNASIEETQELLDATEKYGMIMSNEAVKASADYQDALDTLTRTMSGVKRGMLVEFLPSITQVMEGLSDLFSGNGGLEKISEGVSDFIDSLTDVLPKGLEVVSTIFSSLIEAITSNLPTLLTAFGEIGMQAISSIGKGLVENLPLILESATNILLMLVEGIISALPQLVSAAGQVITTLALGIAQSLPTLIPTIVDVVLQIAETLIDNLDMMVDASIELILALADGIIEALPKLLEKAPVIIEKLVTAIANNLPKIVKAGIELLVKLVEGIISAIPKLVQAIPQIITSMVNGFKQYYKNLLQVGKELVEEVKSGFSQKVKDAINWGKDLIQNFINGIKAKWNALKESVANVANTVKSVLGFSEPEVGPLSDFHTYAPDMINLFIKGLRDNEWKLQDALDDILQIDDAKLELSGTSAASSNQDNSKRFGDIIININGANYSNENELARAIGRELQMMSDRRAAIFA